MQDGKVQRRFDGLPCPFLVNVEAHVAERTGSHHEVRAMVLRILHIGAGHGHRDRFLLQNDRKAAALGPARIGDRFPADGENNFFER